MLSLAETREAQARRTEASTPSRARSTLVAASAATESAARPASFRFPPSGIVCWAMNWSWVIGSVPREMADPSLS